MATEAASHNVTVITRSHDLGESEPHPKITPDKWVVVDGAWVNYSSTHPTAIARQIWQQRRNLDILYVNSIFSPRFALLPFLMVGLNLLRPRVLLVAPRGELSPDALSLHSWRKRLALGGLRLLVLRRRLIVWHASSAKEDREIRASSVGRGDAPIVIRSDPAPEPRAVNTVATDRLHIVFLARIVPIKNLLLLARATRHVKSPTLLTIIGSVEDQQYWRRCESELRQAPSNVEIHVRGHLEPESVFETLSAASAMVLPTRSENFGHAIAESLAVGCPVIVPDTTLWTDAIRQGGGWVIEDLDDPTALADLLDQLHRSQSLTTAETRSAVQAAYLGWLSDARRHEASLFEAAATSLARHAPDSVEAAAAAENRAEVSQRSG